MINDVREVQRLHIRSTIEGVSHTAATAWCLEHGKAGMGWGFWDSPGKRTWDEYVETSDAVNSNVRRFKEMPVGSLIWTRELNGEYWIGEVTGDWEYEDNAVARQMDLFCLRETDWQKVGTEDRVPGRVVNAFRSSRTLQRIGDAGAAAYTNRLFLRSTDSEVALEPIEPSMVLESLIGAEDLEDLIAVYLQVTFDLVLISRFRSTPSYEYVLRGSTGETVVASVKSGQTPVDLSLLPADSADRAFVFATSGVYEGSSTIATDEITKSDLLEFMASGSPYLPERIRLWENQW